ncbi:hypothetical protein CRG98_026831 [Punica granatum]|uniref:Uncharacterized protein n=1 Tax=Punica granatum TaxID=22663 RepID=A0A2I0JAT3_PUNGR|nr:hypothetical protein CRG98_026831 [Punica granatum]
MEEKRLAQFYTSKDQPLYSNGWEKPNLPCPLIGFRSGRRVIWQCVPYPAEIQKHIKFPEAQNGREPESLYTLYDKVDRDGWEVNLGLFDEGSAWESMRQLPSRCGELGLCSKGHCVACPLKTGLMGWSENCVPT